MKSQKRKNEPTTQDENETVENLLKRMKIEVYGTNKSDIEDRFIRNLWNRDPQYVKNKEIVLFE